VTEWWKRRSLRFRLAAWYGIGGTFLLALFSATLYQYVAYRVALPLDYQLQQDLAEVRRHLTVQPPDIVLWKGQPVRAGEVWAASNPWFELWNEEGVLVRRYWPFVDSRLERLPVAPAAGRETISVFSVSPDVRLRVLSVPVTVGEAGEQWMIRVMRMHEPAINTLRELLIIIAIALPVVIILLVLGGYALTRRWLRPLDRMVHDAHQITAHDLSRRLHIANPHDELGRLAAVFNTTLARLEDSFVTLDRFVADASHELLTPLTTLRSVGEVGLRGARTPEEYKEIVGSMLEEAQRLQLLVEKLLQLARAEGGASQLETEKVRLDQLATDVVDDASVLAEEKGQRIVLKAVPCETETDPLLLRQALQNLVDNAIKYSPPKSEVCVDVYADDAGFNICVRDNGPGIRNEHENRLTERFFRAEVSRERSGGGFGLGLAITKAYMRVLGGSLKYEPGVPRGAVFWLLLPRERDRAVLRSHSRANVPAQ
jgi:heavy metal sensor kinase